MKYSKINGKKPTKKLIQEAEQKFPWLKYADFVDAEINITNSYLMWEKGTWKDGIWKNGIWEDGTWEDGTWEDGTWDNGLWENGTWESGIWETGFMWHNLKQKYVRVKWKNWKFIEVKEEK